MYLERIDRIELVFSKSFDLENYIKAMHYMSLHLGKHHDRTVVDLTGAKDKEIILIGDLHAELAHLKQILNTHDNFIVEKFVYWVQLLKAAVAFRSNEI